MVAALVILVVVLALLGMVAVAVCGNGGILSWLVSQNIAEVAGMVIKALLEAASNS